jgi:hypothetical protein
MKDKRVFRLVSMEVRNRAKQAIDSAPDGYACTVGESNRSLDQNAAQWPILQAFSDQLQWPINGQMTWISPEDWKEVLTAAFEGETVRIAMGMNGGVVMLGSRTSEFGKKQFSEWLEFLHATAAQREIDLHYREHA